MGAVNSAGGLFRFTMLMMIENVVLHKRAVDAANC